MSLAKEFKAIRTKKLLSLADVANKSELTRATIWKMEQGSLPKGNNFEVIISDGLGLKKSSNDYKRLIGLWTAERIKGQGMNADSIAEKINRHENGLNDEAKELLNLLRELDTHQLEQIKMAMERPQVLLALETLNELYAA